VAILALDREKNILLSRFTEDWTGLDDTELEIFSALSQYFLAKAHEFGASLVVDYLQATVSNPFVITEARSVVVDNLEAAVDQLAHRLPKVCVNDTERLTPLITETRAALARGWALAVDLLHSLRHTEAGMSVAASAACALTICFMLGLLLQTKNHPVAAPTAEMPRRTADTLVWSIPNTAETSTTVSPAAVFHPPRRISPVKRSGHGGKLSAGRALRTFAPPQPIARRSEITWISLADLSPALTVPVAKETFIAMDEIELPPMPSVRRRGVRRILQAMAYPFKKLGSGFSN
jgi:hypothetical protein